MAAIKALQEANRLAPRSMFVFSAMATAYAALGEHKTAMDALKKAVELGYPWHIVVLDPGYNELRKLPDYEELSKREK
ncbi:MAG: hypothetical protein HOC23_24290 [Halieaceae bacterium]|nr:hypothetical protein [Halieaceae bacterium]